MKGTTNTSFTDPVGFHSQWFRVFREGGNA
jgi:hypothetical protein